MPLYEYQCDACGHRFERIRRFSDPPLADCPECAGAVRKLMSSPAIQFKGSGWYVTDYAKKGAPDAAAAAEGTGKNGSETEKAGAGEAGKGKTGKKDAASKSAASNGGSASSSD